MSRMQETVFKLLADYPDDDDLPAVPIVKEDRQEAAAYLRDLAKEQGVPSKADDSTSQDDYISNEARLGCARRHRELRPSISYKTNSSGLVLLNKVADVQSLQSPSNERSTYE